VIVGVCVGSSVAVFVGVFVDVLVGVFVSVGSGVAVKVAVGSGVAVSVTVGTLRVGMIGPCKATNVGAELLDADSPLQAANKNNAIINQPECFCQGDTVISSRYGCELYLIVKRLWILCERKPCIDPI